MVNKKKNNVEKKSQEYDFKKIEEKWQKKWEKEKVFEVEENKNKEKFFITTPYPYISGSLHLGHGRAVTETDIYARFKRMKGFNVLYPMAFHITGTPVLGISKAIENGDKNKIQMYRKYVSAYVSDEKKVDEIIESFKDPKEIVNFFIPKMVEEYKGLGIGVDWRRRFTSGDKEHQQMVKWQFKKYKEKGFLVKGKYPVLYSPEDESAMGEDDIQDADSFPVEKQEFTILKFNLRNNLFLVAATLRPETVFGQTNLWINPNATYVKAKVREEEWIMSEEAFEKIKFQKDHIELLGEFEEDLIGKRVLAPGIDKKIPILPSTFTDPDRGTGIVTSVPSDAPYDYIALKELQEDDSKIKKFGLDPKEIKKIKSIPIIKTDKYGDKAGVRVVEDEGIKNQKDKKLEKVTQEVYKEGFHNGVLLDNCRKYAGKGIIEAKENIKKEMVEKGKADVMYETSRKAESRGGGKIIVAVLDNQWFIDFNSDRWKDKAYECLHKIELIPEKMRKQFEDTFEWLDKRPCARKRGLGTELPFDEEWMIESLSDSTIYMTLYTINHLIKKHNLKRENLNNSFFNYVYSGIGKLDAVSNETGIDKKILKEIKKSLNYWMPMDHRHTFVLHLPNHLSFMIFAHAGLFSEKFFPKKISFHGLVVSEGTKMSKSKGNVITLPYIKDKYGADTFRLYLSNSTNISGTFDWREEEAKNAKKTIKKMNSYMKDAIEKREKGELKEIYFSKFNKIVKQATEKIERMEFREYGNIVVYDMFNLIKNAKLKLNEKEMRVLYDEIIGDWIKLVSPICPHLAEEMWERAGKEGFVCEKNWPEYQESKINEDLEKKEEQVEKLIEDINNVKKILFDKGQTPKKVYIYTIPPEKNIYEDSILLIVKKTGFNVEIVATNEKEIYDPENKSKKAKPGKPAIHLD